MGEHQKVFLITPTCADAQVFLPVDPANELKHSFPVIMPRLSL
ncbi:hypothetical protein [Pantoea rodasii]|nr:hypothetical protein [Pantoea rodasii]